MLDLFYFCNLYHWLLLEKKQEFLKNNKFFQLHKKIEEINSAQTRKTSKVKRKSSTKVRWQYMVHKLHITPVAAASKEQESPRHSLVAKEGEAAQELLPEGSRGAAAAAASVKRSNPVYHAFDDANDVDDLYRIADSLLNSAFED